MREWWTRAAVTALLVMTGAAVMACEPTPRGPTPGTTTTQASETTASAEAGTGWADAADAACTAARADTGGLPATSGSDDLDDEMALAEARTFHVTASAARRLGALEVPDAVTSEFAQLVTGLTDYAELSSELAGAYSEGYFSKPLELSDQRDGVAAEVRAIAASLGLPACAELAD